MLHGTVIIFTSFAYLGLLFAIAYYADKRADAGRPVIASPYIYSLSLAVYATAWTFYGSVGRAASDGVGFLPIYIGPTLMIALWWVVMRKILRISKQNRITSLADFIASRYGKSALLGRHRHRHRGDRHPALYLAAAESGIEQLHDTGAVSGDHHAGHSRRGADPAGHRAVGRHDPRCVHDRLRHPPPRRGRAPSGHGRRDRVRIAGQARRVSRGGRVRDLRDLRRIRRHIRARGSRAETARHDDAVRRRRRQLCDVGLAHRAFDDGDHVPAAPVPGHGDREPRREAPQQSDLAVSAVHDRDEHFRAADRVRRPAALSRRQRGRRYLRADVADGAEARGSCVARFHRRPVGGDGHGDRRNDRALHDGVQRPRDAGAAQAAQPAVERAARSHRAAPRHPARRHRIDPAARLPVFQAGRRSLRAGVDRA